MQTSKTRVSYPIKFYEIIMPIYNVLFVLNIYLKYLYLLLPYRQPLLIHCWYASNFSWRTVPAKPSALDRNPIKSNGWIFVTAFTLHLSIGLPLSRKVKAIATPARLRALLSRYRIRTLIPASLLLLGEQSFSNPCLR